MKTCAVLIAFLVSALAFGADAIPSTKAEPKKEMNVLMPGKPDRVEAKEGFEWRLWYIAKSSKSEGVHGALAIDGQWVEGQNQGEEKQTPWGIYVWHGPLDGRTHLWDTSGWLPKALRDIPYPSWPKPSEPGPKM